jgi:hypothetical protein
VALSAPSTPTASPPALAFLSSGGAMRKLSRLAICTKLLRRVEQTENEDEIAHYNELISLFFER